MNTGGGFFFDAAEFSSSRGKDRDADGAEGRNDEGAIEVRKLTQKQETRLMDYLDDVLLDINRGYSKRYTAPKSSNVPTLEAFLQRYDAVLAIIASIPPLGASAALLVSYLLRVTSEVADGIQGYDLSKPGPSSRIESKEEDIERALFATIKSLIALDRFWAAVLRGQMVHYRTAQSNAQEDTFKSFTTAGQGNTVAEDAGKDERGTGTGRYPRNDPKKQQRDARQVVGTRGLATVPQTQRIRLRNITVLARDGLFTWMRNQLDAPPPPLMDETDNLDAVADVAATLADTADGIDDGVNEADLEEVGGDEAKSGKADYAEVVEADDSNYTTRNGKVVEQDHYNDLFSRKLDPDDSDEGDEHGPGEKSAESGDPLKKRSLSATDASSPARKQARVAHSSDNDAEQSDDATTETNTMSAVPDYNPDDASLATLGGTHAPASHGARVLRADVAFAHLFSRTLRVLSDIQERASYEENNANKDATSGKRGDRSFVVQGEGEDLEDEGDANGQDA